MKNSLRTSQLRFLGNYNAFLVRDAKFSYRHELPVIKSDKFESSVRIITFSKAIRKSQTDFECWVCFYENDAAFEVFWKDPKKYLSTLKKFRGVISPDFSISIDAPWSVQFVQTYRGRALASWLQKNGIRVIVNIRYANKLSRSFCCEGIRCGGTIAIGTLGCLKEKRKREKLVEGLEFIVGKLKPKMIVVYGGSPSSIFDKYKERGIEIVSYRPQIAEAKEFCLKSRITDINFRKDCKQGRLF